MGKDIARSQGQKSGSSEDLKETSEKNLKEEIGRRKKEEERLMDLKEQGKKMAQEAQKKAEEEKQRKMEKEARRKAEEERKKQEALIRAEEERKKREFQRLMAIQEERKKAQEEAQRKTQEKEQRKIEEEKQKKLQEQKKREEEEEKFSEARRKAEEEAKKIRQIEEEKTEKEKLLEKKDLLNSEKQKIKQQFDEIEKEKKPLENRRQEILRRINTVEFNFEEINRKEDKIEEQQAKIEEREASARTSAERKKIEKKRWKIEKKRANLEKNRWPWDKKLEELESQLGELNQKGKGTEVKEQELVKKEKEIEKREQKIDLMIEKIDIEEELKNIIKTKLSFEKETKRFFNKIEQVKLRLRDVISQEDEIEQEKKIVEQKEKSAPDLAQRRNFEKQRWLVEEKRRGIESKKWSAEEEKEIITKELKGFQNKIKILLIKKDSFEKRIDEIEAILEGRPLPRPMPEPEPEPEPELEPESQKPVAPIVKDQNKQGEQKKPIKSEEQINIETRERLIKIGKEREKRIEEARKRIEALKKMSEAKKLKTSNLKQPDIQRMEAPQVSQEPKKVQPPPDFKEREEKGEKKPDIKSDFPKVEISEPQNVSLEETLRQQEKREKLLKRLRTPVSVYKKIIKSENEQANRKISSGQKVIRVVSKKPSFKQRLWLRILIVIFVLVALAGILTFWYWFFVIRVQPPVSPPGFEEEKEGIKIPSALFDISDTVIITVVEDGDLLGAVKKVLEEDQPKGQFKRIVVKKEGKILDLKSVFDILSIKVLDSFFDQIENDPTMFSYSQKEGNRFGFVVKIKDKKELNITSKSMEPTMENDFESIFLLMGKEGPAAANFFKNANSVTGYTGLNFRFKTLNENDLGICYYLSDYYFAFTSSWQSMGELLVKMEESVINRILIEDLKINDKGQQVELLQRWLAKDEEVYPEGEITGSFGLKTKSAVIRFQEKYPEEILGPNNLTKGTGIVDLLTREKLNELYSNF